MGEERASSPRKKEGEKEADAESSERDAGSGDRKADDFYDKESNVVKEVKAIEK